VLLIVTREKRTQVNHGVREIGGVEHFSVVYLVRPKSVAFCSHLREEKGKNGC